MEEIYHNALCSEKDVADFKMEGTASVSFPQGRMRLGSVLDQSLGQKANYVFWCPQIFPSDVQITWDFMPLTEPGLAMLFFAASGKEGKDLFDPSLASRTGEYQQYHHGDINAFHVSYFRRKQPDERIFHTCNLRKSYGFYLVAQGADPIPDAVDALLSKEMYHMCLVKKGSCVEFSVNGLPVFSYADDGVSCGPLLGAGRIGFRQMAPMTGEYADLKVFRL